MKTRTNLLLDSLLLTTYVAAANPRMTGVAAHEWLGLAFAVLGVAHLALHAGWTARIASRIFSRLATMSRVQLVVAALAGIAAVTVTVSGFAISRTVAVAVGLGALSTPAWRIAHSASAAALVLLALLHLALNRRWIARALRLHVYSPIREDLGGGSRPALRARMVAWGVPVLLLAGLLGTVALGATGAAAADSGAVVATSSTSGATLTCPATGCTASSCHATSGGSSGGGHGPGGRW
jgi:hypothetical protein